MLDQMINITISALLLSYFLYAFYTDNVYMMLTIPVVVYGIFRYIFLIHARSFYDASDIFFKDKKLLMSFGLWTILVVLIIYGFPELLRQ
jgi:hypothetical protein